MSNTKKRSRRGQDPVAGGITRAIVPGTFDPVTLGHSDIVRRSAEIFDEVYVAVLANPAKTTLFTVEERVALLRREFADMRDTVHVISFHGLLVDVAQELGARAIIRGLRAVSDYDYETQMALMNKKLAPKLETFFLVTREEYSYISSTLVKQVAGMGGAVDKFVSSHVESALSRKLSSAKTNPYVRTKRR